MEHPLADSRAVSKAVPAVKLSVVAPCFNEEEAVGEFVRRAIAACSAVTLEFEVIVVNDGSTDGTWERLLRAGAGEERVVCVNLSKNHGHQLALTAGLSLCRGERVLIIDADLQDPPELVSDMMRLMDSGADVVYGQRQIRQGETVFKRWSARLFYRVIKRLTDTPIPEDTGDFRLISRRALNVLLQMPERHRFIRGMISWIGFVQRPLLFERASRHSGKTKFPFRKMVGFAFDAITAFSIKPLRIASVLGVVTGFISVGLVIYSVYSWLFLRAVTGWTSLMAAVSMLSAVQLFTLGVFGEYLGRLYDQSKGRPLFIIESVVSGQAPESGPGQAGGKSPDHGSGG